jgi:hypothetical protein
MKIRITTMTARGRNHPRTNTLYKRPSQAMKDARAFLASQWEQHKKAMGTRAKRSENACDCQVVETTIEGRPAAVAILAAMLCNGETEIEANYGAEIDAGAKVTGTRIWDVEGGCRMVERREAVTP